MNLPFNKPYLSGKEAAYIAEALAFGHLSGDGPFTKKCNSWLESYSGCRKALLTHSCTAALEMAAILAGIEPGDEIIMPSYTFVSTANAFVLRGGVPVFVDIRPDTLNIDETKIEGAITPRTKAIVPVHYAGVACEMDAIMSIAQTHGLLVIEDAAQAILARYKGRPLGSIGHMAALSFHETKNIISGEGGALLVNDPVFVERAEIIREKGTNRSQFFRGQIDKYTWVDIGSSYLPSELIAAFLWAQLECAEGITKSRLGIWDRYHRNLAQLEERFGVRRHVPPPAHCQHNAHMYYLTMSSLQQRSEIIEHCRTAGIHTAFHYVPLHASPAGGSKGRSHGDMTVTLETSERLVRLPFWLGIESHLDRITQTIISALERSQHR
jgi:dTDP-4-amino-4,6-dideoxygalactose transaminase